MKNKLILFALAILLASCASRRDKAVTFMNDNPEELAKLCALHFKPIIEVKPGKTIHVSDTIYKEGERIPCPPNEKGEVVYVRGRDREIRDTVWRTDTLSIRDTAKEAELSHRLRVSEDDVIRKEEKINQVKKQRNISYWVIGVITLGFIGRVIIKRYLI